MEEDRSIERICAQLGLPSEVSRSYERLKVCKLFEWQYECLHSSRALQGNNLVYCAPTSGGKTLVAELLILRHVLVQRKKVIFVLPYVSLVLEKERYFKRLLTLVNKSLTAKHRIKVRGFHGDQSGLRSYKENILICTIEKANGVFNNLIMRGKGTQLGCVVFDEMHVLGNSFNGYLVEMLIR
jgi:replicative superfamily II helicase